MSAEVSVELPNGETFICKPPGVDAWDRYLDKVTKGDSRAGQKELILQACTSHEADKCRDIIARWPGIVEPIVGELDGLAGSDHEFEIDWKTNTFKTVVDGAELVFAAASEHRYEQLQVNLKDAKLKKGPLTRDLLKELCTEPDRCVEAMNKYPTLMGPALPCLTELAGSQLKITVKKG